MCLHLPRVWDCARHDEGLQGILLLSFKSTLWLTNCFTKWESQSLGELHIFRMRQLECGFQSTNTALNSTLCLSLLNSLLKSPWIKLEKQKPWTHERNTVSEQEILSMMNCFFYYSPISTRRKIYIFCYLITENEIPLV